jgi:hypothetical protein
MRWQFSLNVVEVGLVLVRSLRSSAEGKSLRGCVYLPIMVSWYRQLGVDSYLQHDALRPRRELGPVLSPIPTAC